MSAPYRLHPRLQSRAVSFENPDGRAGGGGRAASPLGIGRKGAPARMLASGGTVTLADIAGLLAGLLALSTLLLFSFAPVAWVFSQSTESIAAMGGLHLFFALIALCFGLRFLLAGFRQWEARALGGAVAWILIFVLVTLQLTTALRPIIGRADTLLPTEKRFFLTHWADCLDGKYDRPNPKK